MADEVGYGKTAVTLALLDASKDLPSLHSTVEATPGLVPLEASLVVVPKHLLLQWESEAKKFLRKGVNVMLIKDAGTIYTIEQLQKADLVLVPVTVLESSTYWQNLASFAATGSLPAVGKTPGRHWTARLEDTLQGLRNQTKLLADRKVGEVDANIARAEQKELDDYKRALKHRDKLDVYANKRMTGAAYARMNAEKDKLVNKKAAEGGEYENENEQVGITFSPLCRCGQA